MSGLQIADSEGGNNVDMKIQQSETVIIAHVSLLVAASSLMPIANAAEKLQTALRVGTYFRAGHVPDGMVLAQAG